MKKSKRKSDFGSVLEDFKNHFHFSDEFLNDIPKYKNYLFDLCELYSVRNQFTELRRQQNINYRLKAIIYLLLIVIIISVINK